MSSRLPVVDFNEYSICKNLQSVPRDKLKEIASELCGAFEEFGVVYLINHGIKTEDVDKVNKITEEFFRLPDEVKFKYVRQKESVSGWVGLERERLGNDPTQDYKEYMQISLTDLKDKNWPAEVPEFRGDVTRFCMLTQELARRVLRTLAIGLHLPDDEFFVKCHNFNSEDNHSALRFNYYPQPSQKSVDIKQKWCGEHSDYHTVTLLFQDAGGLEVKMADGIFVPVPPLPGAVIINAADLLSRWTAGGIISVIHRVVIPAEDKRHGVRRSIAHFVVPDKDTVVECLDGSGKYPAVVSQEFIMNRIAGNFY